MREGLVASIAVLLVALLFAERASFRSGRPGRAPAAFVLKPLASLGFLALALVSEWPETDARRLVVLALALSVVGDVCLLSRARAWFLGGLIAFLLAHVAYSIAFVVGGFRPYLLVVGLVVLSVPAWLVLRALWPALSTTMKRAVPAYVVVISVMLALAMATKAPWISGPALLFYLSDLFVARERFLSSSFLNRLAGLPLYYAAQVLFAWG
jgi:uncharacterized membrane protein YhhN